MKQLTFLLAFLLTFTGTVFAGGSTHGRAGYGPVTMTTASTCYPSDDGFVANTFDGDLTVTSYYTGSATDLEWNIQVTNFTEAEDPSGASFVSITPTPHTETETADTIVGPIERMRFCITTCTGDCTMKVKVVGRVAP